MGSVVSTPDPPEADDAGAMDAKPSRRIVAVPVEVLPSNAPSDGLQPGMPVQLPDLPSTKNRSFSLEVKNPPATARTLSATPTIS
eukprot:SAG25_NODE_293_length_10288_cov_2.565904_5_plen_85_part_00